MSNLTDSSDRVLHKNSPRGSPKGSPSTKQKKTSKPRKKNKQHIFQLKGINPIEIDKQYGFDTLDNSMLSEEKTIPNQSTRITELSNVGIKDTILTSFFPLIINNS